MAAALRLGEFGFHGMSVADVAADVGVTVPAVYRHFPSEQALLAAIGTGLDLVDAALERSAGRSIEELVGELAAVGIERSDLWVLLQREIRFLDGDLRTQVQERFDNIIERIVARLGSVRPGLTTRDARLLVAAATAILSNPTGRRPIVARRVLSAELESAARCPTVAVAVLGAGTPGRATDRTRAGPGRVATHPIARKRDHHVLRARLQRRQPR